MRRGASTATFDGSAALTLIDRTAVHPVSLWHCRTDLRRKNNVALR
jgi:hypothetical protein